MLVLVRHGETDWNAAGRMQGRTDIALNQNGRRQAHDAGTALSAGRWDLLFSSPLSRAVETAEIIGARLGLEPGGRLPELVERGYGDAEGRSLAELSGPRLEALLRTAEPEESVVARAVPALRTLAAEHPEKRIVVVAHGTLIRLAMSELLGRPFPRVLNGQAVTVAPELLRSRAAAH